MSDLGVETEGRENDSAKHRAAVVLIHGTWAPKSEWVRSDSQLTQHLKNSLPQSDVVTFSWTGQNGHQARLSASDELSEFIVELGARYKAIYLLGHSHGGNVILYSVRRENVGRLVTGAVLLSTPFLTVHVRSTQAWVHAIGHLFASGKLSPIIIGLGLIHLPLVRVLFHSAIYEDAQEDISERIDETLESARELAERISVSRIEVPCFVASVSGDEALMHLGSIDWFLNAMWGSLRLLIFLLLGGAIAFLFRSASGWEGPFELAPSEALVLLGVAVALFGPVLIASVSRIIRGSPVGYGQEPLVAGPVRIIPSATPAFSLPGGSRLRRYRRPILGSRLRHCRLYDDREVIRDLCTWLRADDRNGAPIDAPITGSTRKSWVIASFAAILIGALGCFALPYGVEGDSVEDAELPLLPPIANQCRLSEAQWDKLCADARLRTQVRPPCPPCSGRPKPSDAHRRNRV